MSDTTLSQLVDKPETDPALEHGSIGPYRLLSCLGKGGMGRVYRAEHHVTGRLVALKVVSLEQHQLKAHLEKVTQEAMAMSALRDPHIITCYSFGEDGYHLYLALELISGGDTAGLVARQGGRLSETTIRALATSCLLGLTAIHRAKLVHRDIKPANILLDGDGRAKLADFGLACFSQDLSAGGNIQGTPTFMPPEAINGQAPADIRGDIYSLGVTMYYWATGASPFATGTAFNTLQKVLSGKFTPLQDQRPDLSPALLGVIRTAMQLAPDQRFPDPQSMLRVLKGEDPLPENVSTATTDTKSALSPPASSSGRELSQASPPRSARWRWQVAACMAVVFLVAGLSWGGSARAAGALTSGALSENAAGATKRGPATVALASGYRLPWLGDAEVTFQEHGAVTYARSGQIVTLPEDAWLEGLPAPSLTYALATGGDFSIELTIHPANLVQEGPARIFSIGLTPRTADLMIGQSGTRLEVRVRTTITNTDGTRPHVVSEDGALDGHWQHVAFVRSQHQHVLYIDGQERARVEVGGTLESWDPAYPLCVGNDHRGGFPWSGSLGTLVVQSCAWTPEEVAVRYRTWQTGDSSASAH